VLTLHLLIKEVKDKKETVNFRGAVHLGKCLCVNVNTHSQNEGYWLYFLCGVITTTSIILSSQDPIIKARSIDEVGSSGNSYTGRSTLAQKNFPWDKEQKRKLM